MQAKVETNMGRQDVLAQYSDGRREFDNLEFVNFLYLDECELPNICFRNCWMDGTFARSNLENADFSDSCIKTVEFHGSNLTNSNFRRCAIDAVEMDDAILDGADFEGATAHSRTYAKGEMP